MHGGGLVWKKRAQIARGSSLFWTAGDVPGTTAGGRGGIRTHEAVARLPVFKTGAFNHSATRPQGGMHLRLVAAGRKSDRQNACIACQSGNWVIHSLPLYW